MRQSRYFPFRYKLTLLISFIILILLFSSFFWVKHTSEKRFITLLTTELSQTQQLVKELMIQRHQSIKHYSESLEGDHLIRELLTDNTFDQSTRDDILQNEIMPAYRNVDVLALLNINGELLAADDTIKKVYLKIQQTPIYEKTMHGEMSSAHLFYQGKMIQLFGMPVFLREEMIGILVLGSIFTIEDINKFKQLSGAELSFFDHNKIFISTNWNRDINKLNIVIDQQNVMLKNRLFSPRGQISVDHERYIYTIIKTKHSFVPSYLIAKSLDQQMSFMKDLQSTALIIVMIILIPGLILSFIFARSISKPIAILEDATQQIERENFKHRVHIHSHDEFSILGQSFNHMLAGLGERETLRNAINRVVSKEVAENILASGFSVKGERKPITLVYARLEEFQSWSTIYQADALLSLMNNYFTRLSFCIDSYSGIIDKYANETLQAIFGAPLRNDAHIINAFQSAQLMMKAANQFKHEKHNIPIRIAIHADQFIVGNLGADNRNNYTAVGTGATLINDLLNLANEYHVETITTDFTLQQIPEQHRGIMATTRLVGQNVLLSDHQPYQIYQLLPDHIPQQDAKLLNQSFTQAINLFHTNQLDISLNKFNDILVQWPEDGPCLHYIDKIQSLKTMQQSNDTH